MHKKLHMVHRCFLTIIYKIRHCRVQTGRVCCFQGLVFVWQQEQISVHSGENLNHCIMKFWRFFFFFLFDFFQWKFFSLNFDFFWFFWFFFFFFWFFWKKIFFLRFLMMMMIIKHLQLRQCLPFIILRWCQLPHVGNSSNG